MSLVVWLPLTKDLRQQGLCNIGTINSNAVYSATDGKLGGCYKFTNQTISMTPTTELKNSFNGAASIACWVKVSTSHGAYAQCVTYGTVSTAWTAIFFGIDINGSGVPIGNVANGTNNTNCSFVTAIKDNQWHHLCLTYVSGTIKSYLDGVLKTTTSTSYVPAWTNATTFTIGGNSSEVFKNGDAMNDVRLYNHCLSPMEVKELAKGLVLHYPLDRQGWGQENLGNFASVISNWTMDGLSGSNYTDSSYGNVIKLVTSSTNQRMYNYVPAAMWQSGKVYTVSFLAKADTNGRTCDMSRSIADFSPSFTLTANWKRYSGKIISTATPNGGTLSFRIHQSGATVYITQIKVEEGALATPYCPHYNDSLYTTMGLNSTTEYDCSGLCNNGTRIGTFIWTSDTPKYQVSQYFNGSSYILTDSGTFSWFGFDKCTVAVWMKPTSTPSSWAGTFGIAHNNSASNKSFVIGNYGGTFTVQSANGNWVNIQSSTLPVNEWHHCVATLDGTTIKMYFDGELVNTYTTSWGSTTVASDTRVQVGIDLPGSDEIYQGYYSDARIYVTTLSADDVKSLYQNSAYIDSSGNVYGAVHSEV